MCLDDLDLGAAHLRGRPAGKRPQIRVDAGSGRYVRACRVKTGEHSFDVAVDATLRAALIRPQTSSGPDAPGSIRITAGDLRKKLFKRPRENLIVIVVDASDSMGQGGTFARMKAAKGAALALLAKAHLGRHRVAMVAFRDKHARIVLYPTASISRARRQLKSMTTGGATPFADGLLKAWQVIRAQRIKDPAIRPLMVVISDGEANVASENRPDSPPVMDELIQICQGIGRDKIASIIIDTRPLSAGGDAMQRLARALGGAYHHINGLKARHVVESTLRLMGESA